MSFKWSLRVYFRWNKNRSFFVETMGLFRLSFCMLINHFGFLAEQYPVERPSPCVPSPCGSNAICRELNGVGSCSCIENYLGNPYEGCRPECVVNSDCQRNKACMNNKCRDPCPGTCGQNADCGVVNHLATCSCRPGFTGDPFSFCRIIPDIKRKKEFFSSRYIRWNIIWFLAKYISQLWNLRRKIPVYLHHVGPMPNVESLITKPFALVYRNTKVLLRIADPNVSPVLSALKIKHASIRNVKILVWILAASWLLAE